MLQCAEEQRHVPESLYPFTYNPKMSLNLSQVPSCSQRSPPLTRTQLKDITEAKDQTVSPFTESFMMNKKCKVTHSVHAISFLQIDHLATADATSLNHPSDGSEDQEETHDTADQSGEVFFFFPALTLFP